MGLVHELNAPASSLHSNVRLLAEVRLSVPVKLKLAELELEGLLGWAVMLVSGGVVSELTVCVIGALTDDCALLPEVLVESKQARIL